MLANILSQQEFGIVGIFLIFQAFATILVDSGFGAALLREKEPTQRDYSTVFWFNLGISLLIYIILFLSSPLIGKIFNVNPEEMDSFVLMARTMFTVFVINGLAIIQVNRLMKMMNVRLIAIANTAGLITSGIIGVWLALIDAGAWALIWQNVVLSAVKTIILWVKGGWIPSPIFSFSTIKRIRGVGLSVFSSALLNTISLNIYNFIIALFFSKASLGVYTQADKWSKMGSASISQILTSSFVPLLAKVQDSMHNFHRYVDKVGRFTSFILMPAMIGLTIIAAPLFHLLFGNKWDAAIPLFQILCLRGIFVVLISLYSNYLLALGKARILFISEVLKDSFILMAIFATIFFRNIPLLIAGQGIATFLTWLILLPMTARAIDMPVKRLLGHIYPFLAASIAMLVAASLITLPFGTNFTIASTEITDSQQQLHSYIPMLDFLFRGINPLSYHAPQSSAIFSRIGASLLIILLQTSIGTATYILIINRLKMPELPESLNYLLGRFQKNKNVIIQDDIDME